MTRVRLVLSIVAVVGVGAVLALSSRATAAKPAARPAAPEASVSVVSAEAVQATAREGTTGALEPAKQLKAGFEVPGRLARLSVRKGAAVAEGQLIAALDPEMADAQLQQATAAVEVADAQARQAADNAARTAKLRQSGTLSAAQALNAELASLSAAAQLQAARAQLAQARAARRRHDLRAPFAGVLVDAPDQIGATVQPGTNLFVLEQLDTLVLKLTVPESARGALKPGTKVRVEPVSGGPATDAAWVRSVIPSADPATRRIPVEVVVPNPDGRFTAHTLARAVLQLGAAADALALPSSALSSQGGDHVFALADGAVRRIPVEVLDRGADRVVVRSREPLQRVVDYPAPDLAEGARVSVK